MENNSEYVNIAEERGKHLLSLDALDLSFLPTTYQPWFKDDAYLLWTKKKKFPDDKDYYEFVIKSNVGIEDDITTQETTHTICHICNTVVPKAYVFEHVNSSKHISYQKIAETGLERARKHKQMIGIERMKSNVEYFCEHCVSVIYLSNRNEHEKSKKHKHFAALDAFLINFALLYTNYETGDIIDSEIAKSKQQDINDNISLLKIHANVCEDFNILQNVDFDVIPLKKYNHIENTQAVLDNETSAHENKLKGSVVLNNAIESCLDNTHKEMNNNMTTDNNYQKVNIINSLEKYIKHLKVYGTVKLHTIDSFNQDRLRIETSNGSELVVSTFNFHGFKKIGKYLQCKLCETVVKNVSDHRILEKHMKFVAQPFEDKHCIRRLQDPFSHCVVCNEIIDHTVVHTQFNRHIRKLEQALVPKSNTSENSSIINKNANVATSISLISTEREMPELPKFGINKTGETNENINLNVHNIAIDVPTIKSISENQYYCVTWDTFMHTNNAENHLAGSKHTLNSKSIIYYLMNREKNNLFTCKVCHTSVGYYTWAVEDHIASSDHVVNYNNYLATNKIGKIKDSLFCKPCVEELATTSELFHIEKQSHKVKLASYNIISIGENSNFREIENKHVDVNGGGKKVSIKYSIENEFDVVDRMVANSEKDSSNLCEHKEILDKQDVENNRSNVQNLNIISDNGAKLNCEKAEHKHETTSVDTPLYECDACNVDIPNSSSNIKVHNDSAKHKTMDVLLTGVNNLLEELLKYFNSTLEIHSHLKVTEVENLLNCIVCSEKISIDDTEKHTNSLKHIHNHRDLMTANKLKLKKDNYNCYACNVYVETGKELRHIETVEHEKRLESFKKGDYVLVTVDNRKLIDKIYRDLKDMESKSYVTKAKEMTFSDFIPNNNKVTTNGVINVRLHFCDLIDNEKQLICMLCQELVENTEKQCRIHTNDINHEANYYTVMSYNQIFQIDDGFVCGFCECIIDGNEFAHIMSEKHIAKHKNDPRKNFCFTCKVSTIDLDLREHVTSECHIKNIGAPAHFYCNVCNSQVTNNETNIQRHNEGFQHQNNFSLIDENKLVLKNKKCVCQVCEATFSRDGLEDHIASLNHIMLLHHNCYQSMSDHCST